MMLLKTSKTAAISLLPLVTLALAVPTGEAQAAATHKHGLGLNLSQVSAHQNRSHTNRVTGRPAAVKRVSSVPTAASLQRYALPPGDQGKVGACVAWATGYSAYGILMKEQGIKGAPMAPMYIYSQIARGVDKGTYASAALAMEQSQGIDTKAHYWQGDFDFTTQPDRREIKNAAKYKISGFTDLTAAANRVAAIKSAIASGLPVTIGVRVRDSLYNLTSSSDIYPNTGAVIGGHEMTIVGYDKNYVTVQNSWGKNWGKSGFFRMKWNVLTGADTVEINSVGKLVQS